MVIVKQERETDLAFIKRDLHSNMVIVKQHSSNHNSSLSFLFTFQYGYSKTLIQEVKNMRD